MPNTELVQTCQFCGKESRITVDAAKLNMWLMGREDGLPARTHGVQVIFSGLSADDRELILTGTHPECWEKAFG